MKIAFSPKDIIKAKRVSFRCASGGIAEPECSDEMNVAVGDSLSHGRSGSSSTLWLSMLVGMNPLLIAALVLFTGYVSICQ